MGNTVTLLLYLLLLSHEGLDAMKRHNGLQTRDVAKESRE
jgi:hypothetical protein